MVVFGSAELVKWVRKLPTYGACKPKLHIVTVVPQVAAKAQLLGHAVAFVFFCYYYYFFVFFFLVFV